jgi:hypothetical protein
MASNRPSHPEPRRAPTIEPMKPTPYVPLGYPSPLEIMILFVLGMTIPFTILVVTS